MNTNTIIYSLIAGFAGLFIAPNAFSVNPEISANKYKTISATACDSLIKANVRNPDFVILDVRTPDVWKSDHLSGSINRNYYDADFSAQLNVLPKKKIFLLHCQSGGRSGPTLSTMKNLNFSEVYEMSGGINSWKSKSLPTTAVLAPKLMLVSNGGLKNGTLSYGMADTLKITLTNRANDTLKFVSVTLPGGSEFSSNFDLKKKLKGSEDYTFSVYYKPLLQNKDSVHVAIASNGGTLALTVILKKGTVQEIQNIAYNEPKIYPNPANSFISFGNFLGSTLQEVSLVNINGQLVKKEINFPASSQFNVVDLPEGVYFVRIVSENRILVNKLVVRRQ
jgi:rhodanese-related sulfurtransferase